MPQNKFKSIKGSWNNADSLFKTALFGHTQIARKGRLHVRQIVLTNIIYL